MVHRFDMGSPTEGIREITADMDDADRLRFIRDWAGKLQGDMAATLRRLKAVIERG